MISQEAIEGITIIPPKDQRNLKTASNPNSGIDPRKKCPECGEYFWSQSRLDKHISSNHGRRRSLRNKSNKKEPIYTEVYTEDDFLEIDLEEHQNNNNNRYKKPKRSEPHGKSAQELENMFKNVEMVYKEDVDETIIGDDDDDDEDFALFEPEISIEEDY